MDRTLLPLERLLVPTDLSPRAEAAVDFAVRLAAGRAGEGAEVVLLHVFSYPYDWYHWETEALAGLRRHVEHEAEARLRALARRKATPGARARPRLLVRSDVPTAVLAAAGEERAGLIVMGTRGWNRDRPDLGSVTAQVVRRASCPVLAVPGAAHVLAERPPGRVLVPVDGSGASAGALRLGRDLAELRDAALLVFHVVGGEARAAEPWGGEAVEAADAPHLAQYERRVLRFAERVLGGRADVRLRVASGVLAGLLDMAVPADLLVLAPHHGGDLTEDVLARTPCPVLVVPDDDAVARRAPAPVRPAALPVR